MEVKDRWAVVKEKRLCFYCLGSNHLSQACRRPFPCKAEGCKGRHHRLLHNETAASHSDAAGQSKKPDTRETRQEKEQCTLLVKSAGAVALRTVPVLLVSGHRQLRINALLDDASTRAYLNADVAAELGLAGEFESMSVRTLNGRVSTFQTTPVEVNIRSLDGVFESKVQAFTTERVTGDLKAVDWSLLGKRWRHLRSIPFASVTDRETIDMLIGIDNADLHFACREIGGELGEPTARLTPIGWTCVGQLEGEEVTRQTFFCQDCESGTAQALKGFWAVEEVPEGGKAAGRSDEEQRAEAIVSSSLQLVDGRYQVAMPWKFEPGLTLPDNRHSAMLRLISTERRLLKDRKLVSAYRAVLDDHLKKGYVRRVGVDEAVPSSQWFLPHFAVVRHDKETTKTRIVFDASARHQGICLNDCLHTGPKLQADLLQVLLRFRRHPVALVCDIEEMYLRIRLAPDDRRFCRFLWRDADMSREPDVFEFESVVFGVNCSPFLAQYVAQQNAKLHQAEFPRAAETVLKSTYMDDSLDSVADDAEAKSLYAQLAKLWSLAGMRARKWLSNSAEVLKAIPEGDRAARAELLLEGEAATSKTLGVSWRATDDVLAVTFEQKAVSQVMTKRQLLRSIAGVFDPCGFVAPFVVRGKMLLQRVWQLGGDWDDELEPELSKEATSWITDLPELRRITVPRCLRARGSGRHSGLHVFVDASQEAYGAVVYLRTQEHDEAEVRFVSAKAKVAPLQAMSIPRLELMAAVLGTRLAEVVVEALDLNAHNVTFWSDSENVIWWIRRQSRILKPFVANRVAAIQQFARADQWRYVPTEMNPADAASRGCSARELPHEPLWWHGPGFLAKAETEWPRGRLPVAPQEPEMRKAAEVKRSRPEITLVTDAAQSSWRLQPTRFSNFRRLQRVTAWVLRFVRNCQVQLVQRTGGELTVDEMQDAEERLVKEAQREEFGSAVEQVKALKCLQPVKDSSGVWRVDGRLKADKQLPYAARHPIILPRKNWLTKLLVKQYHELQGHGGTNQTLAAISAKFWIVSGREAIREWERECAGCKKRRARPGSQQMAPLPDARVLTSLKAFSHTAVDMGGPFTTVQGRGKRRLKRYLALFTCLKTRAVHLEMTYSLDTDSFLNAFCRMVNRRGCPEEMFSDNGGNFVKGAAELKQLTELDKERLQRESAQRGMRWHFQPPAAPHFGGSHEVMIRAAKRAIHAILGEADVTDEELHSAFTGAEALINSRPLTYQSASPGDDVPLTPNHFLHGQVGGHFAPEVLDEVATDPRRRWRRVQELVRHVWRRWMKEWLPGLQPRSRWSESQPNFEPGSVVLVIHPDSPRGHWPLGRVTAVFPG
jgi:hypothetical protein